MPYLFFGSLGWTEALLILGLVVILFGANRIPQIGAGLGQGIRNFKKSLSGGDDEKSIDDREKKESHQA